MFRPSLHSHCSPIPAATLLAATVLGLLFSTRVVRADVGELPERGGLVIPGDKTDEIRMDSEVVVFGGNHG